jgi:LacI family transcriptional regulator
LKTIKDIAKEANVSAGTVDRVLHNRGGVSKKTEGKIKILLKRNNFKTNIIARSLALKKNLKIATLLPSFNEENIFWKSPLRGIKTAQDEVEIFGVKVKTFEFDQYKVSTYLSQFKALLDSKPDGVIIVPTFRKETQQILLKLEEKNIPYIFLNIDIEGFKNISFIGQESYKSGFLAGKLMHLCLQDEGSVMIIQTRSNIDDNHAISKRISGFTDYFSDNKIILKIIKVKTYNLNNSNALKEKLGSILKKDSTIRGVFVPNSKISVFADCIEDLKTQKLSLIGYDGTERNVKCLKEDKVSFLISQKPFKQGYDSIKLMTNYLIEKKQPQAKVYSPLEILIKENINF